MLSTENKFIYVHIPKTGGTSIEEALLENIAPRCYINNRNTMFKKYFPIQGHSFAREYEIADDMFVFTFVRNPWDKLVSEYFYMKQTTRLDKIIKQFHKTKFKRKHTNKSTDWLTPVVETINFNKTYPTFKHFIMKLFEVSYKSYSCDTIYHYEKQIEFIMDVDKTTSLVNFIGRFEHLQQDYNYICEMLDLPKTKLPHLNRSRHNDFRTYYDDEMKQQVLRYYNDDIKTFGYHFDDEHTT